MDPQWITTLIAILGVFSAVITLFVRLTVKAALSDHLDKLNGRYLKTELAAAKFDLVMAKIEGVDADVKEVGVTMKELHTYAHGRIHDIANRLQAIPCQYEACPKDDAKD